MKTLTVIIFALLFFGCNENPVTTGTGSGLPDKPVIITNLPTMTMTVDNSVFKNIVKVTYDKKINAIVVEKKEGCGVTFLLNEVTKLEILPD